MKALGIAATGMMAQQTNVDVISNNIANANTTKIEISDTGIVSAFVDNDPVPVEIGQLTLATFVNDAGMRPLGDNLLQATVASGDAIPSLPGDEGVGILRQGYLESSNVDIVRQITDLIQAQRAYEMNSNAISTADEMMSAANQIR